MNCDAVRARLLEADLAELAGARSGQLADHLRDCTACRALAEAIVTAERALAHELDGVRPRRTAAEALRGVSARAAARAQRRRIRVLVPALAAAAALVVLLARNGAPPTTPSISPDAVSGALPLLQESPGAHVAVLETDNPNIVIVWSF